MARTDQRMEIGYRNYTNGSAPFVRGYERGDLVAGWAGTLTLDESLDVFAAAERVSCGTTGITGPMASCARR